MSAAIGPTKTREDVQRNVGMLEEYLRDLRAYWSGRGTENLRSKINRSTHAVRAVVMEAGCMKYFTIGPPPAFGGLVVHDADPFTLLFREVHGMSVRTNVIDMIEEAIGVVQSPGYLERLAANASAEAAVESRGLERVERICRRLPQVVRQLQARYDERGAMEIQDEYDVQDLLHALLRIDFDDIRREEWSPSYAGGSSRMDFLLKAERIVVEVKVTRRGLKAKDVGAQLAVDIARYQAHPDCRHLVCFVFDPTFIIGNPAGIEKDLARKDPKLDVAIVIAPSQH